MYLSSGEDEQPVGEADDEVRVVLDHHERLLPGELRHDGADLLPALGVEHAGGGVEDDSLRVHREGGGDGDPLLLAAGELPGPLAFGVYCAQPHAVEHRPRPRFGLLGGDAAVQEGRHDLVQNLDLRDLGGVVLEDVAHAVDHLGAPRLPRVEPADPDLALKPPAGEARGEPGERHAKGGLAGADGAEHPEHLAPPDLQRDALEGQHLLPDPGVEKG